MAQGDWIINDSEDEDGGITIPAGEPEPPVVPPEPSAISMFTTLPVHQNSPISELAPATEPATEGNSSLHLISPIETASFASPRKPQPQTINDPISDLSVAQSSAFSLSRDSTPWNSVKAPPLRQKQPKPRPKFKKNLENSSHNDAPVTSNVTKPDSANPASGLHTAVDSKIDDNAQLDSNNKPNAASIRLRISRPVIELSSGDEAPSRPIARLAEPSTSSATRSPSSLFDQAPEGKESTPLSSPVKVKKRKRVADSTDVASTLPPANAADDEAMAVVSDGTVNKGEKKRKKTGNNGDEQDGTDTKAQVSKKKRKSKAKEDVAQEFKSREFIDTSEDDLDLLPKPMSARKPSLGNMDPASAVYPVSSSASMNALARAASPGKIEDSRPRTSASILPSPQIDILPSETISILPSASVDVSSNHTHAAPTVPPPSPVATTKGSKGKAKASKDRKKKSEPKAPASDKPISVANVVAAAIASTSKPVPVPTKPTVQASERVRDIFDDDSSLSSVPDDEPKPKSKKKGKQKLQMEVILPSATTNKPESDGQHAPVDKSPPKVDASKSARPKKGRRTIAVLSSDSEDEPRELEKVALPTKMPLEEASMVPSEVNKENKDIVHHTSEKTETNKALPSPAPAPASVICTPREPKTRGIPSTIPFRREPMSVLIRRASSKVSGNSPMGSPAPFVHSPLAKASRGMLSRIAPLHPNRRTPPPPPPRPPPPKKSKKMLELEEKWEMELAESVEGWACMASEERAALRRAKRDAELGYDD